MSDINKTHQQIIFERIIIAASIDKSVFLQTINAGLNINACPGQVKEKFTCPTGQVARSKVNIDQEKHDTE